MAARQASRSMTLAPSGLPIDAALPALRAALARAGAAVLQAPPGAGKSTVVPLALLGEPWVEGRRLVVLEPRRLAARAVAERMAATLGEAVGERVGYRMRHDTRVSGATRIEVITEGVLARRLQSDPALEDVAAVVFDEFHERALAADLGLALTLDARAQLRPDLRLLLMSATLDGAAASRLLGEAPIVTTEGRQYEVATHWIGRGLPALPRDDPPPERIATTIVRRALDEQEGDVLVFLPGAGEIRRVHSLLQDARLPPGLEVLPLYGDLPASAQRTVLEPPRAGVRRVVLATNLAETSLTIPGVRIVVDAGLARRAAFDPGSGMTRLETVRVSRASADQRRGRAGRTAPGVCYRLWSEGAHRSLAAHTPPEIAIADLAGVALELAAWGARDAGALAWLDPPPEAPLAQARDLLRALGALSADGTPTPHGRAMAALGLHPRLAHLLLRARALGAGREAAELVALLSERDLLRARRGGRDADLRTRHELLRGEVSDPDVDPGALDRARRFAHQLAREGGGTASVRDGQRLRADQVAGGLLALAYPDRVGRRRAGGAGRYALANGRGAYFSEAQSLSREPLIVATDLDDRDREARILLAAPVDAEALEIVLAGQIVEEDEVAWSDREEAVVARRVRRLGALVLSESVLTAPAPEASARAMVEGVRALGLAALPWTREARELQERVAFVRHHRSVERDAWPDLSDEALEGRLDAWLAPALAGLTRRAHLARLDLESLLRAQLPPGAARALDRWAPSHLVVPTGSRIRIGYADPAAPTVAVRLQEVFGLMETPRLCDGTVPVTFTLLSPAHRPVQVTRDLAGFWRGAYAEVRKDLRGRYPKHAWPENPLEAQPTRGGRK
jgi:ATP-dependent helicase HrpB